MAAIGAVSTVWSASPDDLRWRSWAGRDRPKGFSGLFQRVGAKLTACGEPDFSGASPPTLGCSCNGDELQW
jgi:hypothetical protein